MNPKGNPEQLQLGRQIAAAQRAKAAILARESLLTFMRLTMPDPEHPDDATKSRYEETPVARLLCQIMEQVFSRQMKRVGVSIGPQMGKSQITSRGGPAWMIGKDPYLNLILGTYNQDFANEFGDNVREILGSAPARQVFGSGILRVGGKAKDLLITREGGRAAFVGRGGSGTGKPADIFIVDDPLKDDAEAQSNTTREQVWNWFNKVAMTRCHKDSAIVIVHCMVGATPVLMADGSEKALGEIRPGDKIATYAEGRVATSIVKNWASQGEDFVFEIRTASGRAVRANQRHPFLIERDGGREWKKLRDLKVGDRLVGVSGWEKPARTRAAASPRSAEDSARRTTTKHGGLLANDLLPPSTPRFAEGTDCGADTASTPENTRRSSPSRAGNARSAESPPTKRTRRPDGTESCASTTITTAGASEGSCATTAISRSDMEKTRTLCSGPLDTCVIAPDEIVAVDYVGAVEVFDIEVEGTANFIAGGLVSHNTRWHQDDLIGRLMDPEHPERDKRFKGIAKRWQHYNIPAIIDDPKLAKAMGLTLEPPTNPFVISMFGTKPMSSIWPARKSLEFFAEAKQLDPSGFSALNMGNPTPEDGDFFKAEWLATYERGDLPTNLMKYGASDHALTNKKKNDPSVIGVVGVDEDNDIWVMPDVVIDRMKTDKIVDELISQMKIHEPAAWWLEEENISKAFGPFLIQRMHEERVFCVLDGTRVAGDKSTRARAIQGRMALKTVKFPAFAPWWPAMRREILNFPNGAHDDFVDFLSLIGQGLLKQYTPRAKRIEDNVARVGSIEWTLRSAALRARKEKIASSAKGW